MTYFKHYFLFDCLLEIFKKILSIHKKSIIIRIYNENVVIYKGHIFIDRERWWKYYIKVAKDIEMERIRGLITIIFWR